MSRRGQSGFTLIEVLVVVIIIMALAAMMFPVFRMAVEETRRSACMSNLRQIAQAVAVARQDDERYPTFQPSYVGVEGIPQGEVTGLPGVAVSDLWCALDPYPQQIKVDTDCQPARDRFGSTYSFGYNYYGYVTAIDGTPFPVTTRQALAYFFGYPQKVDPNLAVVRDWDLGVIKPDGVPTGLDYRTSSAVSLTTIRPAGLYQGLWNVNAPANTIVTFCPHHPTEKPAVIPLVTLAGEARAIEPVWPVRGANEYYTPRTHDPAITRQPAAIDWRLNKAPLPQNNRSNALYGNALGENASQTPLVEVSYRRFRVEMSGGSYIDMMLYPNNAPWYDTGIPLQAGDLVMVVANARWNFYNHDRSKDVAFWTDTGVRFPHKEYAPLFNESGKLRFTADGDPVEARHTNELVGRNLILRDTPHCTLVGYVGDPNDAAAVSAKAFAVGSRGSHLVTADEAGSSLCFTMNDTFGAADNSDNIGWCETWIAIHHP